MSDSDSSPSLYPDAADRRDPLDQILADALGDLLASPPSDSSPQPPSDEHLSLEEILAIALEETRVQTPEPEEPPAAPREAPPMGETASPLDAAGLLAMAQASDADPAAESDFEMPWDDEPEPTSGALADTPGGTAAGAETEASEPGEASWLLDDADVDGGEVSEELHEPEPPSVPVEPGETTPDAEEQPVVEPQSGPPEIPEGVYPPPDIDWDKERERAVAPGWKTKVGSALAATLVAIPWGRLRQSGPQALVLLALFPSVLSFLWISIGRMGHPFEVEWLEGEVAMYAVRWIEQPALSHLYPEYNAPADDAFYVPHLYPPLYQIAMATMHGWTGWDLLLVGRLLSFLATLGAMGAIAFIVREATGSWGAGLVGAASLTLFYRASGYWFDLVRVDSLALALGLWSAHLIMRRRGGVASVAFGLFVGFLAHFTKQTALLFPLAALAVRVAASIIQLSGDRYPGLRLTRPGHPIARHPRLMIFAVLGFLFVGINAAFLLTRGEQSSMAFYLYTVGGKHPIFHATILDRGYQEVWQHLTFVLPLVPLGLWLVVLSRRWRPRWEVAGAALVGLFATLLAAIFLTGLSPADWLEGQRLRAPSTLSPGTFLFVVGTWSEVMLWAVSASVGAMAVLALRWVQYRTALPGLWWLALFLLVQYTAMITWVKIGGFVNNLMPMYAVVAVGLGLALGWSFRGARRALGPMGIWFAAVPFALLFAVGWFGTVGIGEGEVRTMSRAEVRGTSPFAVDGLGPWGTTDTWWGNQIPPEGSRERGNRLLERIRELHADGGVYLPHQNYLAWKAGVPYGPSVDAIRDLNHSGYGTPRSLLTALEEGWFRHVVLNQPLAADWLPGDVRAAIAAHYEPAGEILPRGDEDPLLPRTGARVIPRYLYTRRGTTAGGAGAN